MDKKGSIYLVTKDYFYCQLNKKPGEVKFNKVNSETFEEFFNLTRIDKDSGRDFIIPYFETGNDHFFVYLNSINLYLIPDIYDKEEVMREINESKLVLSDWKLRKVSDKVPYIINTYLRANHSSVYSNSNSAIESGSYIIENDRTNEKFNFSIYTRLDFQTYNSYIGFDDMAYDDDLIRTSYKFKKEELFELILKNNGRCYYKRFDSKS